MVKNWAKINMRRNNNTQYRPEQFKLQKYLIDDLHVNPQDIGMEVTLIKYDKLIAIADVFDRKNHIIYRLNGESHDNKRQRMKDEDQKEILESMGYTVVDIDKDSEWSWLWL